MPTTTTEQRVTTLESVLADFIRHTDEGNRTLRREMGDFKREMINLKEESQVDFQRVAEREEKWRKELAEREEQREQESIDRTEKWKKETAERAEKHEQEIKQWRQDMNRQWGALANKMGTLVEDLIAPAIRPVVRQYFLEEPESKAERLRRYNKIAGKRGEFDLVVLTQSYVVLVEAKTTPTRDKILEFKNDSVPRFRELYPEYNHLTLIPVFASITIDAELVEFATGQGIYAMAYRDWEYMDLLNFEALNASTQTE